jgi:hypothetical protein
VLHGIVWSGDVKRTALKIDETKKLCSGRHELERGSKNNGKRLLGGIKEQDNNDQDNNEV